MNMDDLNKKFEELSLLKKFYAISLLLIIFIMVAYIVTQSDKIQTITYSTGCKETFINGEINGSYCEYEREMIENQNNPLYQNIQDYDFNNITFEQN